MAKELEKSYDPRKSEKRIYQRWIEKNYFHAVPDKTKNPYTIVIPPPNITGQLHMGHALDNTLQDILIRYRRMQGYSTLWMPGTDHAAIATEAKIVEAMKKEGLTKEGIGRDAFMERAWEWKEKYAGRITEQLKVLGSSCDWERQRFTMDEGCSKAVREVFVNLYEKGLIYRGERIINWCPKCRTALSDAEVEFSEQNGVRMGVMCQSDFKTADEVAESLAKLKVIYEGGVTTAGNASGRNDGGSCVLMMTEEKAKALGYTPIARWVCGADAGVDPKLMGIGPAYSNMKVLDRMGMKPSDISVYECNEAFAAQNLGVIRQMETMSGETINMDTWNPNGGAIAFGHPNGASGTRIALSAIRHMENTNGQFGLVSSCCGGGIGVSALFERV